jgi:hypothetical protein
LADPREQGGLLTARQRFHGRLDFEPERRHEVSFDHVTHVLVAILALGIVMSQ